MPRRDGTGPLGCGPMTGRGFGVCTEANANYYGFGCGRGYGRGMGLGLGFRSGLGGNFTQNLGAADKDMLSAQKNILEKSLDAINKQLENLSEK